MNSRAEPPIPEASNVIAHGQAGVAPEFCTQDLENAYLSYS